MTPAWLQNQVLQGVIDPATAKAYANLHQILASGGRVDPYLRNRKLSDFGREIQGVEGAVRGRMSRAGLENSGVARAMEASAAGNRVRGQGAIRSDWNEQQAQRLRDDLSLWYSMSVNPAQAWNQSVRQSDMDRKLMKYGQRMESNQNWGQMISAIGSAISSYYASPQSQRAWK